MESNGVLGRLLAVGSLSTALLALAASAGDLADVRKAGTLRHIGVPYANFVTGSGDGMDVDLMKAFAAHLGVKYEYVRSDWPDVFGDLTGTKVKPKGDGVEVLAVVPVKGDVVANGLTVLPWREKIVSFSPRTFPNQVWLVAKADSKLSPVKPSGNLKEDIEHVKKLIAGQPLLGKAGTCLEPSLYKLESVASQIILFPGSLNDLAPALIAGNGGADLTLLDVPDALVALQKFPGKIKILGPVCEPQDMAVAFAKDSPELLKEFNVFLEKSRKDGSFATLVRKYYPQVVVFFPDFIGK